MGRKKKKEEPEIYHTPFDSTIVPPPDYFKPSPYIIDPSYMDVTTLGDTQRRYITTTGPGTSLTNTCGYDPYTITQEGDTWVYSPTITSYPPKMWSTTISGSSFPSVEELRKNIEKEVIGAVNLINVKSSNKYEHIVACRDENDLSVDRVLKVLSATKGKIMIDVAPVHVKELECSITPAVRKNIVTASKKLKMYGKRRPIISRYDEWGNPLPDEIELGTEQGVTLKIVDPEKYGEYYFELKATEFSNIDYDTYTTSWEEDLPF